jgi:hypothetical protein
MEMHYLAAMLGMTKFNC